jgi:hypothetical protein
MTSAEVSKARAAKGLAWGERRFPMRLSLIMV